ncbi:MAG: hypothetical protein R3F28_05210 [Candidatus Kapaibacterium sp.]
MGNHGSHKDADEFALFNWFVAVFIGSGVGFLFCYAACQICGPTHIPTIVNIIQIIGMLFIGSYIAHAVNHSGVRLNHALTEDSRDLRNRVSSFLDTTWKVFSDQVEELKKKISNHSDLYKKEYLDILNGDFGNLSSSKESVKTEIEETQKNLKVLIDELESMGLCKQHQSTAISILNRYDVLVESLNVLRIYLIKTVGICGVTYSKYNLAQVNDTNKPIPTAEDYQKDITDCYTHITTHVDKALKELQIFS